MKAIVTGPFWTGIPHGVPNLCPFVLSHGLDNGKFEGGSFAIATELDWSCLAMKPVIYHLPAKHGNDNEFSATIL